MTLPSDRTEELLARWLEGDPDTDLERALDAAAAADPAFAAELAAHRALRAELRALPREIAPARDLFPAIARRAGLEAAAPSPRGALLWRRLAAPLPRAAGRLALAAGLVAALAVGWSLRARVAPAPLIVVAPPPPAPDATVARTAYAATGRELDAIRDELRRSIEARRDALPPATRRLVFDNLATIESAIAEIEAALAAAPADAELARAYVAYRQRQLDLLRQANRLAARL
jgi:anti-sigma factor RsiW